MKRTPLKRGKPLQRKTPLRVTTRLRSRSAKQSRKVRDWVKLKAERLALQIIERGYTFCEKCDRTLPESLLQFHHVEFAGRGGSWTDDNGTLLGSGPGSCHCHPREHGERVAS